MDAAPFTVLPNFIHRGILLAHLLVNRCDGQPGDLTRLAYDPGDMGIGNRHFICESEQRNGHV